jgi:hypothetical protein
MGYKLVMRHIDFDDVETIRAKNKDEVIEELLWILQRQGFYTDLDESDY